MQVTLLASSYSIQFLGGILLFNQRHAQHMHKTQAACSLNGVFMLRCT
jgi:hypothetical protein